MLNEAKSEAIVFCVPYCIAPPTVDTINVCGCDITPQSFVRDVFMDNTHTCKTIVHALATSKLDYGNAVLFGVNVYT